MNSVEEYERAIETWRNEYISERNSKKGWEILQMLAKMQLDAAQSMETDEPTADFDDFSTSKLVDLIIGDIDAKDLLVDHQIVLLEFIPTAHPNVLRHVARKIREKSGAIELLKTDAVAVGIAFARRVTDGDAGEEIGRLMAILVENPMICDELKSQLKNSEGREGSVERSRIFAIASERARISADSSCIHWLYEEILKAVLDKSDELSQLDALDTFVDVALSGKSNAEALFNLGVVHKIYELMEWSRESPDSGNLYFYGVRFLCYMARSYAQVLKAFPDFVKRLMMEVRMFDQLSVVSRLGVFDHFASLCYSLEAKQTMEDIFKDSKDLENTLGAAGAACTMGTMEMKCRTVQAVTLLFENSNNELAETWYERLGGKALTHVAISNVKQPFPELKTCIFDFWKKIFDYPTVIKSFVAFQNFVDWCLDATTENNPQSEFEKRQIIQKIIISSENPTSRDVINANEELIGKFKKYLEPVNSGVPRVEEMAL